MPLHLMQRGWPAASSSGLSSADTRAEPPSASDCLRVSQNDASRQAPFTGVCASHSLVRRSRPRCGTGEKRGAAKGGPALIGGLDCCAVGPLRRGRQGPSVGFGAHDGGHEIRHPLHPRTEWVRFLVDAGSGVPGPVDDQPRLVRHGTSPRVSMPPHAARIDSNSLMKPYRRAHSERGAVRG